MANELVLIVEDNEKNRKLARDVLQFHGYEILETDNAEEGIKLAKERQPAPILMDFHSPGMNGIEALGQLRADASTKDIPVIAVTASAMTEDCKKKSLQRASTVCKPNPYTSKSLCRWCVKRWISVKARRDDHGRKNSGGG